MSALFTAAQIAEATKAVASGAFSVNGVSIDSRTLRAGDLFVALKTESGDGHAHVPAAFARNAAGALVHDDVGAAYANRLVRVADTMAGLQDLGRFARARYTGKLVAVTGSVGKTTTKEMLRCALSACGSTHASVASYNNHWGVPLTLARMPEKADFAIIEIGMNYPGEIAPLSQLARPHVAVITTIEATHIGNMGSLHAIAEEKASIAAGLAAGGILVLPEDSPMFAHMKAQAANAEIRSFGRQNIIDVQTHADGSDATITVAGHKLELKLPAPGLHIVYNAVAVLTACNALGVDLRRAAEGLSSFAPGSGRGAKQKILNGQAILLDESYNASGASVRAALAVLNLSGAKRRVAVLGDMLELGEFSLGEHVSLKESVVASADLVFTCGPWMQHLHQSLPTSIRGAHCATSAELAPLVAQALQPGDVVLIKGSLGSRMRIVVDAVCNMPGGNS